MRLAIAISILLTVSVAKVSAAVIVTVTPLLQTISPGSTAAVQIGISGLGLHAAPSLGAYDLNIAFDPAVLSFTGLTFGDSVQGDALDLSGAGTISDFSISSAGVLEFYDISLDPAALLDAQQADRFVLATATFRGTGGGRSNLVPSINAIGDSTGAPIIVSSLQAGGIEVVATPEPNTWMLAFPLAAVLIRRKHCRS